MDVERDAARALAAMSTTIERATTTRDRANDARLGSGARRETMDEAKGATATARRVRRRRRDLAGGHAERLLRGLARRLVQRRREAGFAFAQHGPPVRRHHDVLQACR